MNAHLERIIKDKLAEVKARKSAALHSKATPEWFTPSEYVEAARAVMGRIDLDPASCDKANETVKASQWFCKEDNALSRDWYGRVFLNPPGGLVKEFWRYLLVQMEFGRVSEVIWIGYSLQQLQTLQTGQPGIIKEANCLCFPKARIQFTCSEEDRQRMQAALDAKNLAEGKPLVPWKNSPTHANYIAYFGRHPDTFAIHFAQFGERISR